MKVFNPHAPSNKRFSTPACYAHHEQIKRRLYEQRINEVELVSFTPLIFSATGGMGKSAAVFYGRLADMIATKTKQPYSSTITWIRCRLNFLLIRSSVSCLRGSCQNSCPNCLIPLHWQSGKPESELITTLNYPHCLTVLCYNLLKFVTISWQCIYSQLCPPTQLLPLPYQFTQHPYNPCCLPKSYP